MKQLIDPYELVANALNAKKETLSIESRMHEHPSWDSIENIEVIAALESKYGIAVDDKDVMNYTTMQAIVDLYEKLKNES